MSGIKSHDGDERPITKKLKSCGAELNGTTRVEDETGAGISYEGTTAPFIDAALGISVKDHHNAKSEHASEADTILNCVDVRLYHGAVCDSHVRST